MKKLFSILIVIAMTLMLIPAVEAEGNAGVTVNYTLGACGEVTFTVTNLSGNVDNMYFVVEENGVVTYMQVTHGNSINVVVPAVFENTTIYWRVFGGAERDYDLPLWNGYGTPGFGPDITNYGNANGYGWVIAGTSDTNPFTTWNTLPVEGCPLTKDQCKNDGWVALGFRNQGLCIQESNRQLHAD